jgi:hypothetical protein
MEQAAACRRATPVKKLHYKKTPPYQAYRKRCEERSDALPIALPRKKFSRVNPL